MSIITEKVKNTRSEKLALYGGTPAAEGLPARGLISQEEKAMAIQVFDESIASGNAFGYGDKYEKQYEDMFVEFMGGGFADGVSSGTNAIFCSLGALRIEPLSEVIVPPITDAGGVMPVVMLGCVPVFADSDPRSYNTNAEQIEKCITDRTKAIILAHIAGDPVDMDPVMMLARKYNLFVIEDCAQAHGATYKGKTVGTFGDVAAFSTMCGKHHCTGGQGGIVYTKSEELHWNARRFADRGKPFNIEGETDNVMAGINCNLNELSAAIGIEQIKKLPQIISNRRIVGEAIKDGFVDSPALSLGWQVPDTRSSYWFLKIKLDAKELSVEKSQFCKALAAEGLTIIENYDHIHCKKKWFTNQIGLGRKGYPWTSSEYRGEREPKVDLKNATDVVNTHFNILIYESYKQREIEKILSALKKVEKAYLR